MACCGCAATAGLCVCLQVLPVNDTCVYNMWWDSYPYSSVCVYALHPQYLALRATLDDLPGIRMPADIAAAIEAARVSVRACVRVGAHGLHMNINKQGRGQMEI